MPHRLPQQHPIAAGPRQHAASPHMLPPQSVPSPPSPIADCRWQMVEWQSPGGGGGDTRWIGQSIQPGSKHTNQSKNFDRLPGIPGIPGTALACICRVRWRGGVDGAGVEVTLATEGLLKETACALGALPS